VYGPGMSAWAPAGQVPPVAQRMNDPRPPAIPPANAYAPAAYPPAGGYQPAGGYSPARPGGYGGPVGGARSADVIDYEIFGSEMQYVEVTLDPGEVAIAEAGAMMYMTPGIVMQSVFGDPSAAQQGFWNKVVTAGKRVMTGASLFMTTYTNQAPAERHVVAFAAPYPGKILAMHLDQMGGELICQKDSFLAAARGVQIAIAFQRKIGVALFGGEGFIMQRLTGNGIALLHAGGTIMKRTLAPGETLRFDTGCLVAMQNTVSYDIQMVGGFRNAMFGGEGLFLATVTGPGDVWLQSLPFARLAGRILANASGTARSRDEGSVLGSLGGLLRDGE
jgi:uncharacterized protein (TIGR00266 family)